jgi:hypothetical protein
MTKLEEVKSAVRGVKKFYKVSVGVVEAVSWLVILGYAWITVYKALKNYTSLNELELGLLLLAAFVISFRLAYEGAKYFRDLGEEVK